MNCDKKVSWQIGSTACAVFFFIMHTSEAAVLLFREQKYLRYYFFLPIDQRHLSLFSLSLSPSLHLSTSLFLSLFLTHTLSLTSKLLTIPLVMLLHVLLVSILPFCWLIAACWMNEKMGVEISIVVIIAMVLVLRRARKWMRMRSEGPGFEGLCDLKKRCQAEIVQTCSCSDFLRYHFLDEGQPSAHAMYKKKTWTSGSCLSKSRSSMPNPPSADVCSLFLKEGNTAESVLFVKDGKTFYTAHWSCFKEKMIENVTPGRLGRCVRCEPLNTPTKLPDRPWRVRSKKQTRAPGGLKRQGEGLSRRDAAGLMTPDWPAHVCKSGWFVAKRGPLLTIDSCFQNVFSADLNREGERLNMGPSLSAQQRITDIHLHRGCGLVRLRVRTPKPLKRCYGLSVVDSRNGFGSLSTRSRAISNRLSSEYRTFLRAQFFFQNFLCLPFFRFEHSRLSSFTTRRWDIRLSR